jgi:hypothetical protein
MNHQSAPELGLEPCGLGRHDIAGVGYRNKLLHRDGIKCKGHLHLTAVNPPSSAPKAPDATNEIDPL